MSYRERLDSMREEQEKAAKILECEPDHLSYYSWPQAFGSTAGPFGGCGGQMVTTFQIDAWTDGVAAVIFCGGRCVKTVRQFEPMRVRF